MSDVKTLQHMSQHIRNVVGCDAVQFFLGCAESGLRHPLLNRIPHESFRRDARVITPIASTVPFNMERDYLFVGSAGIVHDTALLCHERIQALCDLAMQTGKVQRFERWQQYTEDIRVQTGMIAPLEHPPGVLGFLLLTDSRADAFGQGERLLLQSYLPLVAQKLEAALLHCWHTASQERNTTTLRRNERAHQQKQAHAAREISPPHEQLTQQHEVELLPHEFISLISHELRNPLAAIKGYAILLRAYGLTEPVAQEDNEQNLLLPEPILAPQRQREYLDSIIEQTGHLEVLLADLLDISRLHAGHLLLRYTEVNAADLCQRVVQMIEAKYRQSSTCEIICTLPPNLPTIWADPHRLQQIVSNVLDNAMKYSPRGGMIDVCAEITPPLRGSLAQASPEIAISVRDRGIGIAPQHHHQLFQPFTRLRHGLTDEIPGIGLGLYITRKLAEAMNGRVTLKSREGEGTTVTITLPYSREHICAHSQADGSKQVALSAKYVA